MARRMMQDDSPAAGGAFDPLSWGELWRQLNGAREVDPGAMRAACAALFIFYFASSLMRPSGDAAVFWIRAGVLAYIGGGALLAPRVGWGALRAYTVGLALLLGLATAALTVLRGNHAGDLALMALALFGPMIFLQTAVDLLLTMALLGSGAALLMVHFPPLGIPPSAAGIVLGGALVAGAIAGMVLIAFRGRVSQSTAWWQEACGRERALREFAERVGPQLGEAVLGREFAARFRSEFGSGHCALVLGDAQSGPHVVATAGAAPGPAPDTAALAALLAALTATALLLGVHAGGGPWTPPGGAWLALPIPIDDAVGGAVVLSTATPRPVCEADLLLWRAMAGQVGTALGSARLFARLQEALRTRGEFVDTMSHELRSPLHVILGYADMIAEGSIDAGFAAGRMRASALELLLLVENTMTAARLGRSKLTLAISEFDLATLLDEVRETAEALPEGTPAVALRWEIAADLPPLCLDRLKLKEVVHNLVSNALKFTARGTVTVRARREDGLLRLDVDDTGSGIPAEMQSRIFDMFERFELPGAPRPAGVGLGLYIVRSLVGLMHGSVSVESAAGQGARFTVRLPIRFEAR
ncbi:MAG: MFS domain-containing histidine kinase [bacterium]